MQPILKINLTTLTIDQMDIPSDWVEDYLGGASLAARFLYRHIQVDIDPLAPEAPILFMNGPLTGTAGPAVGRFVICGRSPATRLWGESNCGGFWGPELRSAGYTGVWIEGRAEEPVYLWIQDDKVKIQSASHLWGMDTYQTQATLEEQLQAGKVRVAAIGPAGEKLIPFALVLCDHGRVAGRTGMGALMGSKNLKAIAVQGHGKVPIADPAAFSSRRSEINRTLRSASQSLVLRELGTSSSAEYFNYLGEMPKRYFQEGGVEEELHISGAAVKETILTGISACHACVIACGRVVTLEDGVRRKGPEYETLMGFGPNLGLNNAILATHLGEMCDRYGLDSISMSNVIGLAFRLYEIGVITPADTSGLVLEWGKEEVVAPLIQQTVRGEGIGNYLAQGARALAKHFGAPEEAVQVNNLEIAYHDPRGATGMALVYATSPRGGCHNQSDYFLADIGQVESSLGLQLYPRLGGAEKAANVARHQDWRTLNNALVICLFANVPPENIAELVNLACGFNKDLMDFLKCGERGWNLKRVINNRLGLTRANDTLPKPLLRPRKDNPLGDKDTKIDFPAMLDAYYIARGWDLITGYPTFEKLSELGLAWAAQDLWPPVRQTE